MTDLNPSELYFYSSLRDAPVNVQPPAGLAPAEEAQWQKDAVHWQDLNSQLKGARFNALTIKAGYVIGVIYGLCESVTLLLQDRGFARRVGYLPAYVIFASGIEILGRCVKGESNGGASTLQDGFKWLADPDPSTYQEVDPDCTLITTSSREYKIDELRYLRNYAAHGQATRRQAKHEQAVPIHVEGAMDYEILARLHPKLRDGVQSYWSKLKNAGHPQLSTNLAKANIIPFRHQPILECFLQFALKDTDQNFHSVSQIFDTFKDQW